MSTVTKLSSNSISLQQAQGLMNVAEGDIRTCLQKMGERPLAEIDQTCKEIGKRIAGIEASLAAVKCDEDTLESFQLLTADLRCLTTRVSIAARQAPPASTSSGSASSGSTSTAPKLCDFPRLIQKLSTIAYKHMPKPQQKLNYEAFGVYATANECGQRRVRNLLKTIKKIPNGVHLGVSGLHNWDVIAHMRSRFAILVDFNPKVVAFNRKMLAILAKAKNPEDFVEKAHAQMKKDLKANNNFYMPNILYKTEHVCEQGYNPRQYIQSIPSQKLRFELERMLKREDGALSNDNFSYLQQLAREGRIVPMHLDFCDTGSVQAVADAVHEENLVFSSLYLSNAYDYLIKNPSSRQAFKKSVQTLQQDQTCIIDTSAVGFSKPLLLKSYLHYGKDPETGNLFNPDISRGWCTKAKKGGAWLDTSKVNPASYYKQPEPLKERTGMDAIADRLD